MRELPVVTNDLVQRMERHMAPDPGRTRKDGRQVKEFGQTISIQSVGGRPSNKVYCFGESDLVHLNAILEFYAANQQVPTFYLSPPGCSRAVTMALTENGISAHEIEKAVLFGFSNPEPKQLPEGLTIERVTHSNLEDFAFAHAHGFEWPDEWRESAMSDIRMTFDETAHHYLARLNGNPVGAASMPIRTEWAGISGGGVLPEFRGRGVHSAMVDFRLHEAHKLGFEIVIGAASFGSTSFRNQQRAGLRLAYVETAWTKV